MIYTYNPLKSIKRREHKRRVRRVLENTEIVAGAIVGLIGVIVMCWGLYIIN